MFETKLSRTVIELENLSRENKLYKLNEERLKQELSKTQRDKDLMKEKYRDTKNKNNILSLKINEIENDFKTIMIERENEYFELKKGTENKKTKNDSKAKVI